TGPPICTQRTQSPTQECQPADEQGSRGHHPPHTTPTRPVDHPGTSARSAPRTARAHHADPPAATTATQSCALTNAPSYEPHGFEGLVVAEIVDRPEHLAVTDGYDHAERRFALDSARRATPPDPPEKHHAVISHIADLLRFHLEAVELGAIGVPEPPHALVA